MVHLGKYRDLSWIINQEVVDLEGDGWGYGNALRKYCRENVPSQASKLVF